MRLKTKLLLIAALFALVLPLVLTGSASAMSMEDGARPNGTGGWKLPSDMVCIVGVHANGNLDIADGVTNSRDCIYLTTGTMNGGTPFDLRGMTTQAACINAGGAGNDGAKHSWATSGCWDVAGNAISLKGLDRTQQMCTAKGGTWVTTGKCVAYGRQFKGQDANGNPLAFGTKGTTQGAGTGYCYTTMNMTTAYPTAAACPSNYAASAPFDAGKAYDWAFSSSKCTYAKGIKGYPNTALTKADGTTNPTTTNIDLSTFTTMGDCLANGASWNNWTGQAATTTTVATSPATSTIPVWDYTKQAPDADTGCLHCHSSSVEYNGPAEREKDSYVKTGHKNMLRKVTAGQAWAGPDGVVYTTDGTNGPINFGDASVMVGGTTKQNLYYIYGDWMAPLPTLVYGTNGFGSAPGATSGYSCGACHTTGYKDNSNIGVQGIGTPGYAGVQPQASFPGITLNAANPKWDLEGITCARCHNAAVGPVNAAMVAASGFPNTQPTGGGMGALTATNQGRTNLCFGCHQSIAKKWPAQGGAAGGTTQYDPTLIPTGVNHGASQGRDFNGHVLGNSFLNSPHARYTGTIVLNSLGKYDLQGMNGSGGTYNSLFKGFSCYQTPSSSSPAKTKDATGAEIKDKATCETLYGVGSWRADNGGNTSDPAYKQGTCATCHDVHNSLFVESQAEAALRKTCYDCHVNNATTFATDPGAPQVVLGSIKHPIGGGTPFDTNLYESACVVCHMATQAEENGDQNSMPVHLWRINTSASYNTFPTADQWDGLNGATKDRNAQTSPEDTYTQAVWVDLDLACGQCHGGSLGTTATHNSAPYYSKSALSVLATGMHDGPNPNNTAPTAIGTAVATGLSVVFTDASTDPATNAPQGFNAGAVSINWGDATAATVINQGASSAPHVYAAVGTYTIMQTVTDKAGLSNTVAQKITVTQPKYSVTVNIGSPALTSNAYIYLKTTGGSTVQSCNTTTGCTFNNVTAGTYKVQLYKSGVTFAIGAGSNNTATTNAYTTPSTVTVNTNLTLTFTHTP